MLIAEAVDCRVSLLRKSVEGRSSPFPGRTYPEQHFHRQTGLDRSIAVSLLSTSFAGRFRRPIHLGIEPDCQGATLRECFVVVRPGLGLIGWSYWSAHAYLLPY